MFVEVFSLLREECSCEGMSDRQGEGWMDGEGRKTSVRKGV